LLSQFCAGDQERRHLRVNNVSSSGSQSGRNRPQGGDFEGQGGDRGKTTQRGRKRSSMWALSFPTSYLVEQGFSAVTLMLSKQINHLLIHKRGDLPYDCTLLKYLPIFRSLWTINTTTLSQPAICGLFDNIFDSALGQIAFPFIVDRL